MKLRCDDRRGSRCSDLGRCVGCSSPSSERQLPTAGKRHSLNTSSEAGGCAGLSLLTSPLAVWAAAAHCARHRRGAPDHTSFDASAGLLAHPAGGLRRHGQQLHVRPLPRDVHQVLRGRLPVKHRRRLPVVRCDVQHMPASGSRLSLDKVCHGQASSQGNPNVTSRCGRATMLLTSRHQLQGGSAAAW